MVNAGRLHIGVDDGLVVWHGGWVVHCVRLVVGRRPVRMARLFVLRAGVLVEGGHGAVSQVTVFTMGLGLFDVGLEGCLVVVGRAAKPFHLVQGGRRRKAARVLFGVS